jgi:hypothetical protein
VKKAEQVLADAKASRAALEPEEREQSVCQTYTGDEWLAHNRGEMPPGRDTAEIVARIQVEHEPERRQAG